MQEQPQKQPHEVVLEQLDAFRWGGLYVGIHRCHPSGAVFDITLHNLTSVWKVQGVRIKKGEPVSGISKSELDFIHRAQRALKGHNVCANISGLGGMYGLRALTEGFAEMLEFFEATTFHGYGSRCWLPANANVKDSQLEHRLFA